jgi:hypothetical protein
MIWLVIKTYVHLFSETLMRIGKMSCTWICEKFGKKTCVMDWWKHLGIPRNLSSTLDFTQRIRGRRKEHHRKAMSLNIISFAKNLSLVRGGEGSDGIFWGIFRIVSLHVCSNVLFRLGLDYIRQCSSGLFLLTFLLHQSVGYLQISLQTRTYSAGVFFEFFLFQLILPWCKTLHDIGSKNC